MKAPEMYSFHLRSLQIERLVLLAKAVDLSTRVYVHEPLSSYQEKMRTELEVLAKELWP